MIQKILGYVAIPIFWVILIWVAWYGLVHIGTNDFRGQGEQKAVRPAPPPPPQVQPIPTPAKEVKQSGGGSMFLPFVLLAASLAVLVFLAFLQKEAGGEDGLLMVGWIVGGIFCIGSVFFFFVKLNAKPAKPAPTEVAATSAPPLVFAQPVVPLPPSGPPEPPPPPPLTADDYADLLAKWESDPEHRGWEIINSEAVYPVPTPGRPNLAIYHPFSEWVRVLLVEGGESGSATVKYSPYPDFDDYGTWIRNVHAQPDSLTLKGRNVTFFRYEPNFRSRPTKIRVWMEGKDRERIIRTTNVINHQASVWGIVYTHTEWDMMILLLDEDGSEMSPEARRRLGLKATFGDAGMVKVVRLSQTRTDITQEGVADTSLLTFASARPPETPYRLVVAVRLHE